MARARVGVGAGVKGRARVRVRQPLRHRLAHDPPRLAASRKELATSAEQPQAVLASQGGGGAEVYLIRARVRVRGRVRARATMPPCGAWHTPKAAALIHSAVPG